jgi:HSP20 family protein
MIYPVIRRRQHAGAAAECATQDFDSVFDRFLHGVAGNSGAWSPPVDIEETTEAYSVRVELPGLTPEAVDVSIEKGVLSVTGKKEAQVRGEGVEHHLTERRTGQFNRTFKLPEVVDADSVEGKFKNGVLELNLPKVPQAKPKKVEISLG